MKKRVFKILASMKLGEVKEVIEALNMKSIPEDHVARKFTNAVFAEIEEKDRQGIIMELIHCMPYIAAYLMDWIEMYSDNG